MLDEPKHDAVLVAVVANIARQPANLRVLREVNHTNHAVVLCCVCLRIELDHRQSPNKRTLLHLFLFILLQFPTVEHRSMRNKHKHIKHSHKVEHNQKVKVELWQVKCWTI